MIDKLRDLVWGMDIPHPTTPDTRELHEKMQAILKFIDTELTDRRFAVFTDEELYVLKRQSIDSSFDIVMSGKYPEQVKVTHQELLNEILKEVHRRKWK